MKKLGKCVVALGGAVLVTVTAGWALAQFAIKNPLITSYFNVACLADPHQFSANGVASASQVNANFKCLLDAFKSNFEFKASPRTVGIKGHIGTLPPTSGLAPTLEDCPNGKITGTDTAGRIEFAEQGDQGCVIRFAEPFTGSYPACTVSTNIVTPLGATASVSTLHIFNLSGIEMQKGEKLMYVCLGL